MKRVPQKLPKEKDRHAVHMLAALLDHNGDIDAAIKTYKERYPSKYHTQIRRTMKTYWNKYQQGMFDLSPRFTPTRTRKVSDELARAAADAFLDVPLLHGLPVYYSNEREVGGCRKFSPCTSVVHLPIINACKFSYSRSFIQTQFIITGL